MTFNNKIVFPLYIGPNLLIKKKCVGISNAVNQSKEIEMTKSIYTFLHEFSICQATNTERKNGVILT